MAGAFAYGCGGYVSCAAEHAVFHCEIEVSLMALLEIRLLLFVRSRVIFLLCLSVELADSLIPIA